MDDEYEYEYAVRRIGIYTPEMTYIVGNFWSDREDREDFIKALTKVTPVGHTYKLIKRRKAGPEEEVNDE